MTTKTPIETKVKAATVFVYLVSTAALSVLSAVQGDSSLVSGLPDALEPFVLALLPSAAAFVAGWQAKHTPRTDESV